MVLDSRSLFLRLECEEEDEDENDYKRDSLSHF